VSSQAHESTPERTGSGWSFHLVTVLGIPIRVHFTFLLLLAWFGVAAWSSGGNPVAEIVFLVLLFACVVLHELGHAVMALRFSVPTREIVLYPIGGVARLERMPTGRAELLIALAGPAVNVVLAAFLLAAILITGVPVAPPEGAVSFLDMSMLGRLFAINVLLVLFNMIPAFPMDGGRVLRAALSLRMPDDRATDIAASVGRGFAILFGLAGFFGTPWTPPNVILILIAIFVFLGASQEASFFRSRVVVLGRVAREAMITRFETLAPQDTLSRASEHLLATHQQDFPVIDAWNRAAGILHRSALLRGIAHTGPATPVLEVMDREITIVPPDMPLEHVLAQLQASPRKPLLVQEGDSIVGMITLENLVEFIEVSRSARAAAKAAASS